MPKKSNFTDERIADAVQQADAGLPVADICREPGISEATLFRWESRYGEPGTAEARRLRQLEEENKRLKQSVAALSLGRKTLQEVPAKALTPPRRRDLVAEVAARFRAAVRRVCAALAFPRL
jgi:putative transposase